LEAAVVATLDGIFRPFTDGSFYHKHTGTHTKRSVDQRELVATKVRREAGRAWRIEIEGNRCKEKHSNTTAHHPVVKPPAAVSTAVSHTPTQQQGWGNYQELSRSLSKVEGFIPSVHYPPGCGRRYAPSPRHL